MSGMGFGVLVVVRDFVIKGSAMSVQFIPTFVELSEFYKAHHLVQHRRDYPRFETDSWDALSFFLSSYAFERQGRSADYAVIAAHCVEVYRERELDGATAKVMWRKFERIADSIGVGSNPMNNPLAPGDTPFKLKERSNFTKQDSVVEFLAAKLQNNIVLLCRQGIKDDLRDIHKQLKTINGIGDKIASFFLRDIAALYNIQPEKDYRYLLQPIDGWIRFIVMQIEGNEKISDGKCSKWMVNKSGSSEPEKLNQGMWYFAAIIAESSRYKVKRSIEDHRFMRKLIKEYEDRAMRLSKVIPSNR